MNVLIPSSDRDTCDSALCFVVDHTMTPKVWSTKTLHISFNIVLHLYVEIQLVPSNLA